MVVEWRASTVGFLDDLLVEVNRLLKLEGPDKLSLAQMLEAGSWKVSAYLDVAFGVRWLTMRREVVNSPKSRGRTPSNLQS